MIKPGVGKTAIAEGLALRIVRGDVPENLKDRTIFSLDMGALIAGAKFRGEFEERLKTIQDITCDSDGKIDNFISTRNFSYHLPVHELNDKEPYYLTSF